MPDPYAFPPEDDPPLRPGIGASPDRAGSTSPAALGSRASTPSMASRGQRREPDPSVERQPLNLIVYPGPAGAPTEAPPADPLGSPVEAGAAVQPAASPPLRAIGLNSASDAPGTRKLRKARQRYAANDPARAAVGGFLDTLAAAEKTGFAPSTLRNWRCSKSDGPPFHKTGRSVRYDPRELEAWLAAHRVNSTSHEGER